MAETNTWKTAVITGGASGIGLRVAQSLVRDGIAVAILDRAIGPDARAQLPAGANVSFHEVDVTDAGALAAAAADALDGAAHPVLALNCAGIQYAKPFEEIDEDRFRRVVEVNLLGSRNFAAACLPQLRAGDQLALVASMAGIVPNYGYSAYCASKFGVVGLAGSLRLECAPRDIDVTVVCPPEVETPMVVEERRSGNDVGLQLKAAIGTLTVERASAEILAGLAARRTVVIPGRRARLARRVAGLFPGLLNASSDRMVRRALSSR